MSLGDRIKTFTPALLLVLAGFVVAYQFVDPAPPTTLTLSAGSKGGAYYAHGEAYRDYLKQHGITVTLLESGGSLENLARLKAGKADLAFVQSGIATDADQGIESLGSIYYEPLWLFLRNGVQIASLGELKGKSIAIGGDGSGTQVLAQQLLAANGIDAANAKLMASGGDAAADALLAGRIDALFLVASEKADTVQRLNGSPSVQLFSFERAEAYTRRFETLSALTLPEGSLDLAADLPSDDLLLLAATATLLVNADLHPALQDLLLQAAAGIHGGRTLFSAAGDFPSPRYSGMPLSREAERFYKSGPSFLQRYLPFWAATLVDRLKVMLLPFIALLLPLFKVMPPLYRWRVRSRIYRWYEELNRIDEALGNGFDQALLDDLDRIDREIRKVHVPLSYSDELYNLRMHLSLIRKSVKRAKG
ncbi:TRAP transporter solute receptor, TAXI family [Mariprofundus ferrinatatus]|uniref:TRAP transporter solute receptor, TAXI family n=1 Tax=Mariprofundus ferrinatatus TaxID=1921087 RepID=A0A2K8L6Q7_9PROT|nr:TAXI family TRAP transporter solute-binding subunit [Mariprofundus ferrinatatus]ATX82998.1 TRAP transporter solute receptor, TAXI family [Mariprofundus ferrinatatus]